MPHVDYQIKKNQECSNMVANILPADPFRLPSHTHPQPWEWGHVGQNSNFSEHGHVAYQTKENHEWGYMVANILPTDLYPPYHPNPTLACLMSLIDLQSSEINHNIHMSALRQLCNLPPTRTLPINMTPS